MPTIPYRLTDEKRNRLESAAREQNMSIQKFIDELVTITLAERDAYRRFLVRSHRGNAQQALEILKSKADK